MERLHERDSYAFKYEIQVRVGDLNYGGHLGASELVAIIHDARVHYLNSIGLSEANLGDGKTGMVIKDMGINFRGEAFLDDVLVAAVDAEVEKDDQFRIYYRFKTKNRLVALAETAVVSFDMSLREKTMLPAAFHEALSA